MTTFLKEKNKSYTAFIISAIVIFIFALLMIYALKHDPNFIPSQLIGQKAPVFTAPVVQGGVFQSQNQIGHHRWVIINFWSSSCYVCRNEAPELQQFYNNISKVNILNPLLLSINIQDDVDTIKQWQKDYKQYFPVIQDRQGLISINYGVTGTPESFFIDPKGIVRYRVAGELNTKLILSFIHWLDAHPSASQKESMQSFVQLINNN